MTPATRTAGTGREAGLALIDIAVAAAVLAIALLGVISMARTGIRALVVAKETEVAQLATLRVRGACALQRIRATDAADDREWLFKGGYEIARRADGTGFDMPDVRAAATVTEGGIAGAVVVEFPVPPLQPLPGRTHAGRLVLYVNEAAMPATLPADAFPFPPIPGLTRLDCDGDGAAATTNLRQARSDSAAPCRLIPGKAAVEWVAENGAEERVEEWFILGYSGHD